MGKFRHPTAFPKLGVDSLHTRVARIKDVVRSVMRALGLNLVAHAFKSLRHVTGRGLHEPTKKAIREDRTIALLRGLIHLLPISASLCLIVLNWNTYYVGVSIYNQAVYQILAKTNEFLIQASLATILLSYIRHEMTMGYSLPFGALFSGLQLTQVGYLWSMEFWGSIRATHLPILRRLLLVILIIFCILLASLSGPSSAVLLIPRHNYWPAGSTNLWLNVSLDELYPTRLVHETRRWEYPLISHKVGSLYGSGKLHSCSRRNAQQCMSVERMGCIDAVSSPG